jgi:hypothetical protein
MGRGGAVGGGLGLVGLLVVLAPHASSSTATASAPPAARRAPRSVPSTAPATRSCDDRLQREATGSIDPDSFTHGTSEQRRDWFERGYESGDPNACDTFSPDDV